METSPFGSPSSWRPDDLIGVSREFNEDLALAAYRSGVFPMPHRKRLMGWYSPMLRGVLPLSGLHITRSLGKMLNRYEIRIDSDFPAVLDGCADPDREGGWIDGDIRAVYLRLYQRGVVHSVEAWTDTHELAGGLYGVSIGGLFAGESMFHRRDIGRDASKAALVGLVRVLAAGRAEGEVEDVLLDVQWATPHLQSLGVVEIDRETYLHRLGVALDLSATDWSASSLAGAPGAPGGGGFR